MIEIWRGLRGDLPPEGRLLIAGGPHVYRDYGAYLETIEASLREATRGEPDIEWLGPLGPDALFSLLRSAGVLPYPCNVPETFCLAVLEAQAAGCLPIVSPLGVLPERVDHDSTGWVASHHALPETMRSYLTRARSGELETMRARAREVATRLSWSHVAERVEAALERWIARAR